MSQRIYFWHQILLKKIWFVLSNLVNLSFLMIWQLSKPTLFKHVSEVFSPQKIATNSLQKPGTDRHPPRKDLKGRRASHILKKEAFNYAMKLLMQSGPWCSLSYSNDSSYTSFLYDYMPVTWCYKRLPQHDDTLTGKPHSCWAIYMYALKLTGSEYI